MKFTPSRSLTIAPVVLALLVGCESNPSQPLATQTNATVAYAEGTPGGVITTTETLKATVVAIDQSKRTFVLKDDQGNERTIQAPPEMVNFSQLAVGDRVRAEVAVETLIQVQDPGLVESAAATALVTAEAGQKPGAVMLHQERMTAIVTSVDVGARTATLKFSDGSVRTVAVRPDVEVSERYVGKEVVIVLTAAMAIGVKTE